MVDATGGGSLLVFLKRDFIRTMLQLLTAAATLLVNPLAAGDARTPAPASPTPAPVIAPCEYDWIFFYRQQCYGIQQYGPVATYRRNTLLIWRSRAHLIPVSVPGVVAIVAIVLVLPVGLLFWSGVRHREVPTPTG
jgi:hypothetical protein